MHRSSPQSIADKVIIDPYITVLMSKLIDCIPAEYPVSAKKSASPIVLKEFNICDDILAVEKYFCVIYPTINPIRRE